MLQESAWDRMHAAIMPNESMNGVWNGVSFKNSELVAEYVCKSKDRLEDL